MSAVIRFSREYRERALRVKEVLRRAFLEMYGAASVRLEEVDGCCTWEIWFPWGVAKDPGTVIEYYKMFEPPRNG